MQEFIQRLIWPVTAIRDFLEFRRLRRDLPSVYRRLIWTPTGVMTETDAEYLDRLRDVYDERFG